MSRSKAVREEAYQLDDYHCQVCGLDARNYPDRVTISPHHNQRLGMGGSDELDTVANVVTLCVGPNSCHDRESRGLLKIENFDRDKGTMEVYVRNSVQEEWRRLPDDEVWFHRRRKRDQAEQALQRLQTIMAADSLVARDMWLLQRGYKEIDPTARSFAEFVSGYGWRPNAAVAAAEAYEYVHDHGLEWPPGVNYRKVYLIAKSLPLPPPGVAFPVNDLAEAQEWLKKAVDMSYTTLEEELAQRGKTRGAMRFFLVFPRWLLPQIHIVRSNSREAVLTRVEKAEGGKKGMIVVELRAFRRGLKWSKAKGGKLTDAAGDEVQFERW